MVKNFNSIKINKLVNVQKINFADYQEFYITTKDAIDENFLKGFISALEKEKIIIDRLVFFGNLARIKKLIPLVRGSLPFFIVGEKLKDKVAGEKVNLYIKGIKITNGQNEKVKLDGEIIGNYFNFPNCEYLSLTGIYLKNKKPNFFKEVQGEYEKMEKALEQYRFSPQNIYRYWNYMKHIWGNYLDFNVVRNAYFKKNNIEKFPAATGIEANLGFSKKISLGFEAIKPKKGKKITWRTISSDLQCEAFKYGKQVSGMKIGPKFSRAVILAFPEEKIKKLYISGISSADKEGESSLAGNLKKNVDFTMKSFENLLDKNGLDFDNVVSAIVYFKNEKVSQEFEKLYARNKWNFPYNSVFTNICRESFSFEIEGVAVSKCERYFFRGDS